MPNHGDYGILVDIRFIGARTKRPLEKRELSFAVSECVPFCACVLMVPLWEGLSGSEYGVNIGTIV